MPVGAPSFAEALRAGAEIFHALRGILKKRGQSTGVGDEGGFAPNLRRTAKRSKSCSRRSARPATSRARTSSSRSTSRRASSGPTTASATIFKKSGEPDAHLRRDGRALRGLDPAVSDRLDRRRPRRRRLGRLEDADRRRSATACSWSATTCSSPTRRSSRRGIAEGVGNALLVKLNQIGTVTETLDAVAMARDAGYATIISHRSGETEDTTIADLAVGTAAGQIKTGSASRTDRVANTTSCCGSKRSSDRAPRSTPGARRSHPRSMRSQAHGP